MKGDWKQTVAWVLVCNYRTSVGEIYFFFFFFTVMFYIFHDICTKPEKKPQNSIKIHLICTSRSHLWGQAMASLNLRTKECPSEDSPTVPWLDTFWLQTRLGRMMEDDSVSPECRSAENPCSSPHSQVGSLLLYGEGKAGTSWYQSMSALLTKQKTGRFNKMF